MAKSKKFNEKQSSKNEIKNAIIELFSEYEVIDCAEQPQDGFTKDTLIIRNYSADGAEKTTDIQVKLIAPKMGVQHYELDLED